MADLTQTTVTVTVRYFAAACAAAGVEEEAVPIGATATVGDVLTRSGAAHGPELVQVLERCSFLLDGVAVHGWATPVAPGQTVDILPPFAGG